MSCVKFITGGVVSTIMLLVGVYGWLNDVMLFHAWSWNVMFVNVSGQFCDGCTVYVLFLLVITLVSDLVKFHVFSHVCVPMENSRLFPVFQVSAGLMLRVMVISSHVLAYEGFVLFDVVVIEEKMGLVSSMLVMFTVIVWVSVRFPVPLSVTVTSTV